MGIIRPLESASTSIGREPQAGDLIAGKYRVERLLGAGGMGRVLAAKHVATGKRVALKWVLNQESTEALERFRREASAAGRIHHANVVDVYDVLEHDGATCLVMEQLHGESLASCLAREQKLPVDVALPIVIQVARGLDAAHREGVIHRDLKPANLFLTEGQGETGVKILDFGISKILDASDAEPVTKSGAVLGTPHYMAPEQVMGRGGSDPRIDVYALGAVLYEMLAGRPPHTHEKLTALLVEIATTRTVPLIERAPEVPPALSAAVMKALTKNPAERYASVTELALALEPFAGGMRFEVSPSGPQRSRSGNGRGALTPDPASASAPSMLVTLEASEETRSDAHASPRPRSTDGALEATVQAANSGQLSGGQLSGEPIGAAEPARSIAITLPNPPHRKYAAMAVGALLIGAGLFFAFRGEPTVVLTPPSSIPAALPAPPASPTLPSVALEPDPALAGADVVLPLVAEPSAPIEPGASEHPEVVGEAASRRAEPRRPRATGDGTAPSPEEANPPVASGAGAAAEASPEPAPVARVEPEPAPTAAEPEHHDTHTVTPRAGRIGLDDF